MDKYDIIIVGGGTAGCAASYTAGKLGFKTLLIEKNIHLGGAITSGLVVPAMNAGINQINTDFFNILCDELHKIGGQIIYQGNKGWFNPELTKIALDNLMTKAGVDVLFSTHIVGMDIENRLIKRIYLSSYDNINNSSMLSLSTDTIQNEKKILSLPIETRYIIDTTGNCEIGKLCNCEFLNQKDELQPVSLRFIMSNIDLKVFSDWLLDFDKDREVTTAEHIDGCIHLSTAYTWDKGKNWALAPLFDDAVNKGILKDTDRNYLQIFTIAGMPETLAFNCPRIPEIINTDDIIEVSTALKQARQSILRLSNFCRKYLPGFENAYISNIADELGVRVSKRIKGKYVYTIDDLKTGKKFENPVVISDYPVDVHSAHKDNSKLEKVNEYQLPVEALMSADIDNLFVAGRCLSADFLSQGALRVQPNCFAMGEGLVKFIHSQL